MYSPYTQSHAQVSSLPDQQPPRQNKMILQRQYREKEGECFNTLRDVIKDLTGEEPQTRQEILKKAIELLSRPEVKHSLSGGPAQTDSTSSPGLLTVNHDAVAHTDYLVRACQWPLHTAADLHSAPYQAVAQAAAFHPQSYITTNSNLSEDNVFCHGFDSNWRGYP